jgi:enoyl-CoA hydratase
MSVIRTHLEDALLWIEIHRPEKLNALNRAALAELRDVLREAAVGPARVLLLTGAGDRAFCAGADIAEIAEQDASGARALMELGKEVTRLLEETPQPVIAVVNGYALGGGCELCLACDLVVASERAQFALPEVDLGILPAWGGTQRAERRIGYGRAREMVLTGRRIPAAEALIWGLCERVAPAESLRAEATPLALTMAARPPGALQAAKRALGFQAHAALAHGLAAETDTFARLFNGPERVEAMDRFLKRR